MILAWAFFVFLPAFLRAQERVEVTEVLPTLLVFATSSGNVTASVGPDGVLLVGTPSLASTPFISKTVAQRTQAAARYVVIYPQDVDKSDGDAGWRRLGAYFAMHENALRRLGGGNMGPPGPLQEHFAKRLGMPMTNPDCCALGLRESDR